MSEHTVSSVGEYYAKNDQNIRLKAAIDIACERLSQWDRTSRLIEVIESAPTAEKEKPTITRSKAYREVMLGELLRFGRE